MSVKRCDLATAVIDDKIFVLGGTVSEDQTTNLVECFDEENEWFVYS
jgi:hypothetical protein